MYPARAFFLFGFTLVRGMAALLKPLPVQRDPCADPQVRGALTHATVPARVRPRALARPLAARRIDPHGAPAGEPSGRLFPSSAASGRCWSPAEHAEASGRQSSEPRFSRQAPL